MRIGKRPDDGGVDDGEQRRRGADAARESKDRNGGEPALSDVQAQAVTNVLPECTHASPPANVPILFQGLPASTGVTYRSRTGRGSHIKQEYLLWTIRRRR